METFISILSRYNKIAKSYKKGEILSFEGDLCTSIRIVISGKILISSITKLGQEIIYKELTSNDIFGHNLIFSNNQTYRGNVNCLENTSLYEFNKEEFLDLLSKDKGFMELFLKYQSEDTKKLNQQIKIKSLISAEEKLFYLLQINNHELKIKSITDLSRKLSISREATSRVVHQLLKQNKISLKNKILRDK